MTALSPSSRKEPSPYRPGSTGNAAQSILVRGKWTSGFLLPHIGDGCYLIEVSNNLVLQTISDQYFIRPNSLSMVLRYIMDIGLLEVVRKIIARRKERFRNEKAVTVGLGRVLAGPEDGIPRGSSVFYVGTNHPTCSEVVSIPRELVHPWREPENAVEEANILHIDWRNRNLLENSKTWGILLGWSPYSGLGIDKRTGADVLREAKAYLENIDWSVGSRLPRTESQQEPAKPEAASVKPGELSAVLFGLGNYAKTIILPNIPREICVKSIHELDPTQIGPYPDPRIAWRTEPCPAPGDKADAYFIAGFHHTHAPIALHALRHGAAAVVEKPICTTQSQLMDILEAMRGGGSLFACFHKRYSPLHELALSDLGQPAGAPINYHCIVYEVPLPALHWYKWANSCSRLVSNGCHWIDHFLFLNQFAGVRASSVVPSSDGTLNVTIELVNDAVFSMVLTDIGCNRVGVQDYVELRANDVCVKMINGSQYVAERGASSRRSARINKMVAYRIMYRTICKRIIAREPGDSAESIASSAGAVLDLEQQLKQCAPSRLASVDENCAA